ncbi:MAG: hypothetical protein KJO07_02650, partial [Deltaproteobacteria bacterium]|nr:hypothetical protein [Deltaproteobacteria bacterium]
MGAAKFTIAVALASLAACGGEVGPKDFEDPGELVSLAIQPPDARVLVSNGESEPLAFALEATYADGTVELVDADDWRISEPLIGGIDDRG